MNCTFRDAGKNLADVLFRREALDDLDRWSLWQGSSLQRVAGCILPPDAPIVGQLIDEQDEGPGKELLMQGREKRRDPFFGHV